MKSKLTMTQLKRLINEADEEQLAEAVPSQEFINKIINFGCDLLMFGVESHIWHLNCDSNSAHLTLKEFYEGCDDIGDKLLESALGLSGGYIENKPENKEYEFGNLEFDDKAISKIRWMGIQAAELIEDCHNAGIENILADFCELCNSVVYKLKRLK